MTINNITDPKLIKKAMIRKVANALGLSFVVGFGFNELLGQAILLFYNATGVNLFSSDISLWLYQIIVSTLMFTLPFILFSPMMNIRVGSACRFERARKGTAIPVIMMGIGFIVVSNYLGNMAYNFFKSFGLGGESSSLSTSAEEGILVPIVAIIAGSVLPAFLEEFALRGVALGALRRFGSGFAIIISAVLFSFMHGNLEQIPFAFLMGLYLGFAVEVTGSIWIGIILHLINNFFAFGFQILEQFIGRGDSAALGIAYFLSALFIGIIGFIIAANSKQEIFKLPNSEIFIDGESLKLSEKIGSTIKNPGMIIFLAYILYQLFSAVITL